MALARPSEDREYMVKGDVLLLTNFPNSTLDSTAIRSGDFCSKMAKDHLNQIVNNHFFIETDYRPRTQQRCYSSSRTESLET